MTNAGSYVFAVKIPFEPYGASFYNLSCGVLLPHEPHVCYRAIKSIGYLTYSVLPIDEIAMSQ